MSIVIFFAVIAAALLHATWNAVIKIGADKFASMVIMTSTQGAIGVLIALQLPWPGPQVWPWLLASGFFHAFYKFFLIFAYERGDLSRVYPIARGGAPLLVLLVGPLILTDQLRPSELFGVLVLGLGILGMANGALTSNENSRLVPFALMSACMTAGYSIVDGMGARAAGDATLYVAWLFTLDAAFLMPVALYLRGRSAFTKNFQILRTGIIAAVASYGAYAIIVWAMTQAPIALVAALRETSILFAVVFGWLIFKEPIDRNKAIAAALIVIGVIITRLAK